MKRGRRRRVRERGIFYFFKKKERRRDEEGEEGMFGQVGVHGMGACQKSLGRRKDDETANCEESCDSAEGDWL